jgi:HD-GYP domain-containing protein (c-di-GMP phosphodiesterase class II)
VIRLAEALFALSLATDAGHGYPLEKSLRNAVIAGRFAEAAGLRGQDASDAYYTSLLRSLGCTSFSFETAALLGGDDVAFHQVWDRLDPGHPGEFLRLAVTEMGAWAPPAQRARTVATFLRVGQKVAPVAARSACEVSASLARRLGLPDGVRLGLDQVYERWDGKGIPEGLAGEALCLPARIAHLVDIAELAHREGGHDAARAVVERRAGGQLDPALAAVFAREAGEILAGLDPDAALAAEPAPYAHLEDDELPRIARGLADFVDLKSPYMLGHSPAVAALVGPELEVPALLHDLGRVAVPNGIWDKKGPLTAAERERVRMHPYYTERILSRTSAFAPLAELAAADHERLDGGGYHRRLAGGALTRDMRLLAAADAYCALTEERPHRPALSRDAAARVLRAEPGLCPDAVDAVLSEPGRRPVLPAGLTEREAEVLLLVARGLTNKEIATRLFLSPRTVQHHVAHIYAKIDRRTRAGAAMFAAEHGMGHLADARRTARP